MFLGKLCDDEVLREVSVLILINKDLLKVVLIFLKQVGIVAQ